MHNSRHIPKFDSDDDWEILADDRGIAIYPFYAYDPLNKHIKIQVGEQIYYVNIVSGIISSKAYAFDKKTIFKIWGKLLATDKADNKKNNLATYIGFPNLSGGGWKMRRIKDNNVEAYYLKNQKGKITGINIHYWLITGQEEIFFMPLKAL